MASEETLTVWEAWTVLIYYARLICSCSRLDKYKTDIYGVSVGVGVGVGVGIGIDIDICPACKALGKCQDYVHLVISKQKPDV